MNRFYRDFHSNRLEAFTISYMETDLWIGVDRFQTEMIDKVLDLVMKLHKDLHEYIDFDKNFLLSFEPIEIKNGCAPIVEKMATAAQYANVGPMAAVAGAFADEVGRLLVEQFRCSEVVVENGGDIFIKNLEPMTICVYAGDSPLSQRVGLRIPPGVCGVCTSSGTVGHSISFGRADAVTVVSQNATIADAFATAYCNMIKTAEDMENLLNKALNEFVQSVLVIYKDRLGFVGKHELVFIEQRQGDESEGD
ncbi:MAG: UPF0280 family protein [Pseudothermotoga sp.]